MMCSRFTLIGVKRDESRCGDRYERSDARRLVLRGQASRSARTGGALDDFPLDPHGSRQLFVWNRTKNKTRRHFSGRRSDVHVEHGKNLINATFFRVIVCAGREMKLFSIVVIKVIKWNFRATKHHVCRRGRGRWYIGTHFLRTIYNGKESMFVLDDVVGCWSCCGMYMQATSQPNEACVTGSRKEDFLWSFACYLVD